MTKQRIKRCYELIVLAKLDPKDAQVHQRFGQEIKKKLQQQLTKNILAPYFQIENFQPQTSMFLNTNTDFNNQECKKGCCCDGSGDLICLQSPENRQYQHVEIQNIQNNFSINGQNFNEDVFSSGANQAGLHPELVRMTTGATKAFTPSQSVLRNQYVNQGAPIGQQFNTVYLGQLISNQNGTNIGQSTAALNPALIASQAQSRKITPTLPGSTILGQ